MIAQARAKLTDAGEELSGRVRFELADGNRLPFTEESFELVMCNSVLHHLARRGLTHIHIRVPAPMTGRNLLR